MAFFDQISGVLGNVLGGNLSEEEIHAHYDQIAQNVPQGTLAGVIGPALGSLGTGELQQHVANSAEQMTPQQRGGLIGTILKGLGGGSNLGGLLGQLGVNPGVASDPQSATPDEVAKLAAHAHSTDPDLFHRAMSFYSEHPTLVKALGTVAIAQIARHLNQPSR